MLRLGPFELRRPIGKGGMGQVWSGVHVAQGTPVAVKVLLRRAADPVFAEAFRREVRAVAGLDHPHIVVVLDHGALPTAAGEVGLEPGSPYLVMELAEATLAQRAARLRWTGVRGVLVALLDALAHAHARGVVHCDLKAANVLLGGARPGVKLSDFGIAHTTGHARARGRAEAMSGGTPSYMAPEQFLGAIRDFGPWTDLYALGCLAWRLLTGRSPYTGKGWKEQQRAHATQPLPQLAARMAVPEGVEAWLHALLQKDPRDRFECAADAAWALLQVGELEVGTERAAPVDPGEETVILEAQSPTTLILPGFEAAARPRGPRTAARREPPPLPLGWQPGATAAPTPRLVGAGLGLFGLRSVPLVDRHAERNALWDALAQVHADGAPRAVVLWGPAGHGKSRLAEWLCQRAHEVGGRELLRARHGPTPGPGEGLAGMVARALRCSGSVWAEARAQVAFVTSLAGPVGDALASLAVPEGAPMSFTKPSQRYAILARWLRSRASGRPVICWLDDAHWGDDAVGFAAHLLERSVPVLLVLTARSDLPSAAVDALLEHPAASRLDVGALPEGYRGRLVRGVLGLEPSLVDEVAARSEGNPLFAIELVRDWVERELLARGPAGYRLSGASGPALPDDVHALWAQRLGRIAAAEPERQVLEVAAALGREVTVSEWRAVCAHASLPDPEGVRERLLAAGLAEGSEAAWRFAHGMLHESVCRGAREAGRHERWHRACAEVLVDAPERVGLHWLQAGAPDRAVGPLLEGAERRRGLGEIAREEELFLIREDALERSSIPPQDEAWGAGRVQLGRLARLRGDLDAAEAWHAQALEGASEHGWALTRSIALVDRATVRQMRGDLTGARAAVEEARAVALAAERPADLAAADMRLALVCQDAGDPVGARSAADAALAWYRGRADGHVGAGYARFVLANASAREGDADAALEHAEAAAGHFEAEGDRIGIADARNYLGCTHYQAGRLAQAREAFEAAGAAYDLLGVWDELLVRINLALVDLGEGAYDRAGEALERARNELRSQGRDMFEGAVCAFLLLPLVAQQRFEAAAEHLERARSLLRATGYVDPDIARLVAEAADLARDQGQAELADAALHVAESQRGERTS